jgi:hypothetical protein
MEGLKYDYYKGPHIIENAITSRCSRCRHPSKSKDMKNESDVFDVISTDEPNEANLRSCERRLDTKPDVVRGKCLRRHAPPLGSMAGLS